MDKEKQDRLNLLTRELLDRTAQLGPSEVDALREALRYHEWRYYVLNDPLIADFEYDSLFSALKRIESDHPELVTPDSPTQRIARALTKEFPAVTHNLPMLSLDNSYNEGDLLDWGRRVRELCGTDRITYTLEPKFDGSSIALVYENGYLVRAATRGDGIRGEEITNNARTLNTIPLKVAFPGPTPARMELRGEIVIPKEKFKEFNQKRMREGLPLMANPRNAASGALRMQDAREVAARGLSAFIYQLALAEDETGNNLLGTSITSHYEAMKFLHKSGFRTTFKEMTLCHSLQEVLEKIHEWNEARDSYPVEIDGMVIKVNEFDLQEKCGSTSHHPRWAIAFKFKARQATTRLLDVEFQVGRTGTITPVAKLDPVPLAGVTISSVSLFNEDIIREKDLRIGDYVLVERAGDVIPYIVKSLPQERTGKESPVIFPTRCPSCGSTLVKVEGEVAWRCTNVECPAQAVERIRHFVSKNAMDIEGLGDKIIQRFYDLDILKSIAGIYTLDYEKISRLEGFGAKSVQNLRESVEASKNRPLHRLIFALGIRFVGQTTARTLASAIQRLEDLYEMTPEQLMELEDIGPVVAESIRQFFHQESNRHLISQLREAGLNLENTHEIIKANPLQGKTFLFTGSLSRLTRNEARELVEQHGGKVLSTVSRKLDYLIVGDSPGSKLEKARPIPSITILDEDQFMALFS